MFILSDSTPLPFYKQLYNQIREKILAGSLAPDQKLPSVRDLAVELSTSRNTVDAAYLELYSEGFIYSRERSGYFVSPLERGFASALPYPSPRPTLSGEPDHLRYDFHPARLAPKTFPVAQWRNCYLETLRDCSDSLTTYTEPQGDWALRTNLREYLERSRGVICDEAQIIITSGLQHGLELLCRVMRERRPSVALEEPGYHLPRAVFANNGYELHQVAAHPCGIDIDHLRSTGSGIVYVTPSHQLPLGHVMPVANRLKLIEWAQTGDNLILEDDYDSELRYHGKPISSLQGLRPDGNIVYLGTFSKVLSPTLRLSYMVLPRTLLPAYQANFGNYFSTVPLLEQRCMAKFMEQGYWERHVRRMRTLYQKKHDMLLAAIGREFGADGVVLGADAGLHVVLRLVSENPGEAEILRRAEDSGMRLVPFSQMCAGTPPAETHLLLGFGGLLPERIDEGVALLRSLCKGR
ncbi:MocR-like pyridoxine biosynthesis transcription factor PdxR [Geomonas oryzae]|uniref:MocR-like pyridoxine biosynthesis transcription factor PdxR n=1 Tax=Geomonas oryzae TaxID=2364273 RepID=UPI00100A7910|nr:PLP-dependent aminotransferase family protein [Geomonas oryzae]